MTPQELLKPRYKAIADWPFMEQYLVEVGKIYSHDWNNKMAKINGDAFSTLPLDKYPHLFKKLEWWEDRKVEDMPGYVKHADGQIEKVLWVTDDHGISMQLENNNNGRNWRVVRNVMCFFEVATESEYNDYIKSKQSA